MNHERAIDAAATEWLTRPRCCQGSGSVNQMFRAIVAGRGLDASDMALGRRVRRRAREITRLRASRAAMSVRERMTRYPYSLVHDRPGDWLPGGDASRMARL